MRWRQIERLVSKIGRAASTTLFSLKAKEATGSVAWKYFRGSWANPIGERASGNAQFFSSRDARWLARATPKRSNQLLDNAALQEFICLEGRPYSASFLERCVTHECLKRHVREFRRRRPVQGDRDLESSSKSIRFDGEGHGDIVRRRCFVSRSYGLNVADEMRRELRATFLENWHPLSIYAAIIERCGTNAKDGRANALACSR